MAASGAGVELVSVSTLGRGEGVNVMPHSIATATVGTPEKSLRTQLDDLQPRAVRVRTAEKNIENAPKKKRGGRFVREVLRTAAVSLEAFQIDAGMRSLGNVSEAMNDSTARSVSLDWVLDQTDPGFRAGFVEALHREWNIAPSLRLENELGLAVALFDRLLRAIVTKAGVGQ